MGGGAVRGRVIHVPLLLSLCNLQILLILISIRMLAYNSIHGIFVKLVPHFILNYRQVHYL